MTPAEKEKYPKRKENLRIHNQELKGERFYIVVNEETGGYYQLKEIEFRIFSNLDGETSLEKIKENIETLYPEIEIPIEYLTNFIQDLKKRGLLEEEKSAAGKKNTKTRGSLFYLRIPVLNPENLLKQTLPYVSFLFKPVFVYSGLFLIFSLFVFLFQHENSILSEMDLLLHGWGLLLLYFSFLIVAFVHEMGHALTCSYYGGKVKEMGFMLIYFEPAFYTNVSDAYLFPDKKHRMYVGLAGLYFQFVFAFFAALIWYFTIPGSFLSLICIAILGICGFTALWNLNPLIKLDGYYVLNDFLEVVNLRARSFQSINLYIRGKILELKEASNELKGIPSRLKKIYFWYALLGIGYTSLILFFILVFLFQFAAKALAGLGVLLVFGGIGFGIWKWYVTSFSEWKSVIQKIKEDAGARLALKTKAQKVGILVLVIILLGLIPTQEGFTGPCIVEPSVKRVLAPLESGILTKVYFEEGGRIKKGEVFAKLDDFSLKQKLAHLAVEKRLEKNNLSYLKAKYGSLLTHADKALYQAELASKSHHLLSKETVLEAEHSLEAAKEQYLKSRTIYARLKKDWIEYQKGVLPSSLAQIQQQIKSAEEQLKVVKKTWKGYSKLAKTGLVSSRRLLKKKSAYQEAKNNLRGLQDQFNLAEKRFIQDYQTSYEQEQGSLKAYQASLESYHKVLNKTLKIEPDQLQKNLETSQKNFYYAEGEAAEIKVAENKLDDIEVQIKGIQGKIQRSKLRSPITGIIMTPHLKEWEGKMVEKGEPVAWVYQPGKMIFDVQVNQMNILEIPKINQKNDNVSIRLLALPGELFSGKVIRIAPQSLKNTQEKYLVEVETADPDHILLPGMIGTAKIYGPYRPLLWHWIRIPIKYLYWKLWSLF